MFATAVAFLARIVLPQRELRLVEWQRRFLWVNFWRLWHLRLVYSDTSSEADWPVERVEHFDGDQHRQRHGCGVARFKHLAVYFFEHGVVLSALHEMSLWRERQAELACARASCCDLVWWDSAQIGWGAAAKPWLHFSSACNQSTEILIPFLCLSAAGIIKRYCIK